MGAWFRRWFRRSLILTAILLFIAAGLFFWGLVKFGALTGVLLVYPWVLSAISKTAIEPPLSTMIAMIVAILLCLVGWSLWKVKAKYGLIFVLAVIAFHSGFLAMIEKDQLFSPRTGQSSAWVAWNPTSGRWDRTNGSGYSPMTGKHNIRVTPKIATEMAIQSTAKQSINEEVTFDSIPAFFDRLDGHALVYYFHNDTGYHFFRCEGYDPKTGKKLMPVTPEVVEMARKELPANPLASQAPQVPSATITPADSTKAAWQEGYRKGVSLSKSTAPIPEKRCVLVAYFNNDLEHLATRLYLNDGKEQYEFVPHGRVLALLCSPGMYRCTVSMGPQQTTKEIELAYPGLSLETWSTGGNSGPPDVEIGLLKQVQYVKHSQPEFASQDQSAVQASIGSRNTFGLMPSLNRFWHWATVDKVLVGVGSVAFLLALGYLAVEIRRTLAFRRAQASVK
jgi:hypothetical protein